MTASVSLPIVSGDASRPSEMLALCPSLYVTSRTAPVRSIVSPYLYAVFVGAVLMVADTGTTASGVTVQYAGFSWYPNVTTVSTALPHTSRLQMALSVTTSVVPSLRVAVMTNPVRSSGFPAYCVLVGSVVIAMLTTGLGSPPPITSLPLASLSAISVSSLYDIQFVVMDEVIVAIPHAVHRVIVHVHGISMRVNDIHRQLSEEIIMPPLLAVNDP